MQHASATHARPHCSLVPQASQRADVDSWFWLCAHSSDNNVWTCKGGLGTWCKLSGHLPPSIMWPPCAMTCTFAGLQCLLGIKTCSRSFEQWHTGGCILKRPLLSTEAEPPSWTYGWWPNLATFQSNFGMIKICIVSSEFTICGKLTRPPGSSVLQSLCPYSNTFGVLICYVWSCETSAVTRRLSPLFFVVDVVFWYLFWFLSFWFCLVDTTSTYHSDHCQLFWQFWASGGWSFRGRSFKGVASGGWDFMREALHWSQSALLGIGWRCTQKLKVKNNTHVHIHKT